MRKIIEKTATGIKVKRFKKTGPFSYEIVEEDEVLYGDWDPSVADDSYFIPNSQAVARLSGGKPYSSDEVKMAYDFPDGKDTGLKVTNRKKGRDLAEISTDIRIQQQELKKEVNSFIDSYKREVYLENAYKTINKSNSE